MKKLIVLVALFVTAMGAAQINAERVDGIIFGKEYTTAYLEGLSNPPEFLLVRDSDKNALVYYDGTAWVELGSGANWNINLTNIPADIADGDDDTIADGSETKVTAGINVTVTGTGTSGSPYIINSTGTADGLGADRNVGAFTVSNSGNNAVLNNGVVSPAQLGGSSPGLGVDGWIYTYEHDLGQFFFRSPSYIVTESGQGLPTGGTTGQILSKVDGTDYNTEWVDQTGGGSGDFLADGSVPMTGPLTINKGTSVNLESALQISSPNTTPTNTPRFNLLTSQSLTELWIRNSGGATFAKFSNVGGGVPALDVTGTIRGTAFVGDGSGLTGITGGISTDQANRIANANKPAKDSLITASVDSLYLDYTHFQAGSDIGRKKRIRKNNGRLDFFPTSETIPVNTVWRLRTGAANDTIAINPLNGYTVIFDGQTTGNAAYITGVFSDAYIEKTGTDTLKVSAPSLTEFTYSTAPSNLYPETDVMVTGTAVVGGWTVAGGTSTVDTAIDPIDGVNQVLRHNVTSGTFSRTLNDITLTNGVSYTVTFEIYIPGLQSGTQVQLEDFGGSAATAVNIPSGATSGWVEVSITRTAANGGLRMRMHTTWGTSEAKTGYYRNVIVTQN